MKCSQPSNIVTHKDGKEIIENKIDYFEEQKNVSES